VSIGGCVENAGIAAKMPSISTNVAIAANSFRFFMFIPSYLLSPYFQQDYMNHAHI
jgi:hypothetical protein